MAGVDRVLELLGEVLAVAELTGLADSGACRAQHGRAAQDRGREDDAEHHATDEAPREPAAGAVVGGLLDLQRAVGGALDHDHALDLERAAVLDVLEGLVGLPRGVLVAEVGGEQRVGAVGDSSGRRDGVVALSGGALVL